MQKAAAQQDVWAQPSVLRGAAGKVASMHKVSFLLLYQFFSSFPYAREKSSAGKKTVLSPGKVWLQAPAQASDLWAERTGLRGRAGPGWGRWPGRGGGGGDVRFVHKNVLRNRLECLFGAVGRGNRKKPAFFNGFFFWRYHDRIFPLIYFPQGNILFFPRETSEGKFRYNHRHVAGRHVKNLVAKPCRLFILSPSQAARTW